MPTHDIDTRSITLVDIPVIRRLNDKGTILDSELGLTRDTYGPNAALLAGFLLTQRGIHTLVARADKQTVVGQFRLRGEDHNAHIVYIAPPLDDTTEDTVWLHILDAMAREAGKHGSQNLIAEVDEHSILFETMRVANFAVYARQIIWRREPGDYSFNFDLLDLTEMEEADEIGITSLVSTTVPGMIQQIACPPSDMPGLVYRKNDRIEGYVAHSEGKNGVYLIPYLHRDVMEEAPAIIESAVQQASRSQKVPVYVCVRRYQDWLQGALDQLAFTTWADQAVLVRHLTAGIRHAEFEPVRRTTEIPRSPVPPPSKHTEHHLG